jgi:glucose-6-phosphate isomerase|tara:strand:+ start:233 stop:1435 length:1203 start_codon:yes stop_codon:yes gene_type:complete
MFKKKIFFNNYLNNSQNYVKNLKLTKKLFNSLLIELKKGELPLLNSFEEDYKYNFSKTIVSKFSKYNNIVIIGIGGSILGAKAIYSFLKKKTKKKLFFFDNLDLNLFSKYNNLNNTCFVVISKSGNTTETIINLSFVFSKNTLRNRLVIITEEKNSALMRIAKKYNAAIIGHKEFIGGRYSVLSETGMFPAALMNLSIKKFKNLKKLIKNKNFVSSLIQNAASIYTLNLKKINNSIILNYDSSLNNLSYWHQQLVAESLGKKGKGIYPTVSFAPKDQHSLFQLYLDGPQNKFFTFFNSFESEIDIKTSNEVIPDNMSYFKNKKIKTIINAQCEAAKNIFKKKKIPFREIIFKRKDETHLGEILTFFVLETIILARLMNVNPFDQPAVEQIKQEAKKILCS